jgi:hypothetical protein
MDSVSQASPSEALRVLVRRRFMNVSKNRPETTNLNHQYTIRRVFIFPVLDPRNGPGWHE